MLSPRKPSSVPTSPFMLAKIIAIMLHTHLNNEELFNGLLVRITKKHRLPENGLIVFSQRKILFFGEQNYSTDSPTTSVGNLKQIAAEII